MASTAPPKVEPATTSSLPTILNGWEFGESVEQDQSEAVITVEHVALENRRRIETAYAEKPKEANRFGNLCTLLIDEWSDVPADEIGPLKLAELRDLLVVDTR